jgi:predicted permease
MGGLRPKPGRHRLLRGIVTVEIAAAVVLTVAAGLLAKGFIKLANRPLGYRTDHVLGLRVRLRGDRYKGVDAKAAYWERLMERARAIPGVALAATVSDLPMGQQYSGGSFEVEGLTLSPDAGGAPRKPHAHMLAASQGYFAAIGIPLLRGRGFTESDGPQSEPVAIVSDAAAAAYWPGQDPIGKRIRAFWSTGPWRRIVGVVGRIRHSGPEYDFEHEIYAPYRQINVETMFLVLRTHVPPESVGPSVRAAMAALDPDVPPFEMRSMRERFEQVIAMDRIAPVLMTVFSAVAASLAALGLFGVIGYWVSQRTRELGIRAAVGARRGELRWLILRQGGQLAGFGIAAGIAVMLPVSRLLHGTIYGIDEHDFGVYAAATGLAIVAALLACWIPAERAARIEPSAALREE